MSEYTGDECDTGEALLRAGGCLLIAALMLGLLIAALCFLGLVPTILLAML